jgi:hypothetical protein
MRAARKYPSVVTIAHPFSLAYTNVPRIIRYGLVKKEDIEAMDAVEVINGAVSRSMNKKAGIYAKRNQQGIVGGSDCHSLRELGAVVTYARGHTVKDFLDAVRANQTSVVGRPIGQVRRVPSTIKIAQKQLVYFIPDLPQRYEKVVLRPAKGNKPVLVQKIMNITVNSTHLILHPEELPKEIVYKPLEVAINGAKKMGRYLVD